MIKKDGFIRNLIIICLILLSVIFVITSNIEKGKVLIIQDNTSNEKHEFYLPDNTFSLGYKHSVLKTPAEEFFYVRDNNTMLLHKTEYESYGVGLPFLADKDDFKIENGKFILLIQREFKKLNMIISPIPNHWLSIGDDKYYLNDILKEPDSSISIYVNDKYVLKGFFNSSSDILISN